MESKKSVANSHTKSNTVIFTWSHLLCCNFTHTFCWLSHYNSAHHQRQRKNPAM